MKLKINETDIIKSKIVTNKFDEEKTYNKFGCTNNHIGVLGELMFDKYLTDEGVEHSHNELTYNRWGLPPFVVNGKTITVKTTKSSGLWIQRPKFDFVVYAKVNDAETELEFKGFVKKNDILKKIANKTAVIVSREERKDYVFNMNDMSYMEDLIYFLKNGKWPKKPKQTTLEVKE